MKYVFHILVLLVIADLVMALIGYGANYDQVVVQPGQTFYTEEFGDLGLQKTPTLACRYWTGMGRSFAIFQQGTGADAKEKCPAFLKTH